VRELLGVDSVRISFTIIKVGPGDGTKGDG
jgi:hypothetical protein